MTCHPNCEQHGKSPCVGIGCDGVPNERYEREPIVRKLRITKAEREAAARRRAEMACEHCGEELIIEGALRTKHSYPTYARNFHCTGRTVAHGEIPHHELFTPATQEELDEVLRSLQS